MHIPKPRDQAFTGTVVYRPMAGAGICRDGNDLISCDVDGLVPGDKACFNVDDIDMPEAKLAPRRGKGQTAAAQEVKKSFHIRRFGGGLVWQVDGKQFIEKIWGSCRFFPNFSLLSPFPVAFPDDR